jgi:hypothetical protein
LPLSTQQVNQRVRTAHKLTIKRHIQALIDIFRDNWHHLIRYELIRQVTKETFDKYSYLITQELNVLKRVIKELSVVYKENAERRAVIDNQTTTDNDGNVVSAPVEDPNYILSQEDTNKNFALQSVNAYTNLSNNVAMKVTWRDGKLDYDVLLFNNVEIYTSPDDWMKIIAYKFYYGLNTDFYGGNKYGNFNSNAYMPTIGYDESSEGLAADQSVLDYHSAQLWVIEDIENNGIIENGTVNEVLKGGFVYTIMPRGEKELITKTEDIPYLDDMGNPILPFVLFQKEYPVDKLLDFTTGNDLRDLNMNIAILLIYLNSLEKYNSFKQLIFNTDDPEKIPSDIKVGPNDVLINPTKEGSGSVQMLDLQADIQAKFNVIKERIMNVLAGYGISPENFTMSASPQSGFALKISNIGKLEARDSQVPMYRKKERELYEIEKTIWNYHNPGKSISDEAEFQVDFAERTFPKSPDEQVTQDEFDLRHNVITEIDILMRKNPDLTEETAKELYIKNKTFNEANQPQPVQIQPFQQPGNVEEQEEEE